MVHVSQSWHVYTCPTKCTTEFYCVAHRILCAFHEQWEQQYIAATTTFCIFFLFPYFFSVIHCFVDCFCWRDCTKDFPRFSIFFFNRLFVRFLSRLNHAFAHNSIRLSTRSSNIKYINVYALCFDPYWSEWTHTLNTVESCWKLEGFFFFILCVSPLYIYYIYSLSAYEWGNLKSHWIECRVVKSLRIAMS